MNPWAEPIEGALAGLAEFLVRSDWWGRENELVNLMAHSFLSGTDGPDGPIDPAQLGIEVAVKQLPKPGAKALVRKDLVLWKERNQTVWVGRSAKNDPVAIMEFKTNDDSKCVRDIDWLSAFTNLWPTVIGYSVCGFLNVDRGITFARIEQGRVTRTMGRPDSPRSTRYLSRRP